MQILELVHQLRSGAGTLVLDLVGRAECERLMESTLLLPRFAYRPAESRELGAQAAGAAVGRRRGDEIQIGGDADMGVKEFDVIVDELRVHIAVRVAVLDGPSEVLVSATVTDLVAGSELAVVERASPDSARCCWSVAFAPPSGEEMRRRTSDHQHKTAFLGDVMRPKLRSIPAEGGRAHGGRSMPDGVRQHQQIRVTLGLAAGEAAPPGTLAELVGAVCRGDDQGPINIEAVGGGKLELGGDLLLVFENEDVAHRAERIIQGKGYLPVPTATDERELRNEPCELERILRDVGDRQIDTVIICPERRDDKYHAHLTTEPPLTRGGASS